MQTLKKQENWLDVDILEEINIHNIEHQCKVFWSDTVKWGEELDESQKKHSTNCFHDNTKSPFYIGIQSLIAFNASNDVKRCQ